MASTPAKQAAIRRILHPESKAFKKNDLVWKSAGPEDESPLYRGQCANATKNIETKGVNPYEISTSFGGVLSTSKVLSPVIERFAKCPPLGPETSGRRSGGRLFEITLGDEVRYAYLKDSLQGVTESDLDFLQAELPDDSGYKGKNSKYLIGILFNILQKEQEVLLDPETIKFVKDDGKEETWGRGDKEPSLRLTTMETLTSRGKITLESRPVVVYHTNAVRKDDALPVKGGKRRRGRTFRTKTLRRNKHGSRFTRQSKHRVRHSHA
jgi:hypothetical protein